MAGWTNKGKVRILEMKRIFLILLFVVMAVSYNPLPVYAGDSTLTWTAPVLNVDGTPVDDLAGYKIYRGFENITGANYTTEINPIGLSLIPGDSVTYVDTDLAKGEYHYRIKSHDFAGNQSAYSNPVKKNVFTIHEAVKDLK